MPWFGICLIYLNFVNIRFLILLWIRTEAIYRLIFSAFGVPWKAYILSTDSYVFYHLLTMDQECFCMNTFYSLVGIAPIIYHTGGSVLRYWYVKASLRPEVAEVFMRSKTLVLCLGIPQILLFLHLLDALHTYFTSGELPFLLYQACANPELDYSLPFHKLMPFQVIMMYIYMSITIYTNVYLFMFLR